MPTFRLLKARQLTFVYSILFRGVTLYPFVFSHNVLNTIWIVPPHLPKKRRIKASHLYGLGLTLPVLIVFRQLSRNPHLYKVALGSHLIGSAISVIAFRMCYVRIRIVCINVGSIAVSNTLQILYFKLDIYFKFAFNIIIHFARKKFFFWGIIIQ